MLDAANEKNIQAINTNEMDEKGDALSLNNTDIAKESLPVRETKNIKSITPKPERKGINIQQRDWKNFAYIKDSKVKLKQDDLLNIHKTIVDIEQGRISAKGI
jgi:biotin-(acetyl-CoA carboxylase) ligase